MIRSMTGFGAAEGAVGSARVAVEVRSVNHRFFNPSIKLPASLARWEGEVREALRKSINRGHDTVTAWVERNREATAGIDESRFAGYVERRGLAQYFVDRAQGALYVPRDHMRREEDVPLPIPPTTLSPPAPLAALPDPAFVLRPFPGGRLRHTPLFP